MVPVVPDFSRHGPKCGQNRHRANLARSRPRLGDPRDCPKSLPRKKSAPEAPALIDIRRNSDRRTSGRPRPPFEDAVSRPPRHAVRISGSASSCARVRRWASAARASSAWAMWTSPATASCTSSPRRCPWGTGSRRCSSSTAPSSASRRRVALPGSSRRGGYVGKHQGVSSCSL